VILTCSDEPVTITSTDAVEEQPLLSVTKIVYKVELLICDTVGLAAVVDDKPAPGLQLYL
jgi:hypothetical protein